MSNKKIEGVQDAILDIINDHFSSQVVAQVQSAITLSQDIEKLKKFLRQLFRVSDEQEVLALLTESFPLLDEITAAQEMILDVVSDHFSPQVVAHVRRVIEAVEDVQLLRKFHRLLVRLSKDEKEAFVALDEYFPITENLQLVRTFLGYFVQLWGEQEVSALWGECFPTASIPYAEDYQ